MPRRRLGWIEGERLLATLVKITLSAVLMGVTASVIQPAMDRARTVRDWPRWRFGSPPSAAAWCRGIRRRVELIQGRVRKLLTE